MRIQGFPFSEQYVNGVSIDDGDEKVGNSLSIAMTAKGSDSGVDALDGCEITF
jgi:hypothetical protein